jgi:Tfp pilus assembly PilM family ATPase
MDEVSLDFSVIGPAANEEDMEVMLAASRKEKVEDRVAVAEAAGLTAKVMDIESYAARAAVQRLIDKQANEGRDQVLLYSSLARNGLTSTSYLTVMLFTSVSSSLAVVSSPRILSETTACRDELKLKRKRRFA